MFGDACQRNHRPRMESTAAHAKSANVNPCVAVNPGPLRRLCERDTFAGSSAVVDLFGVQEGPKLYQALWVLKDQI